MLACISRRTRSASAPAAGQRLTPQFTRRADGPRTSGKQPLLQDYLCPAFNASSCTAAERVWESGALASPPPLDTMPQPDGHAVTPRLRENGRENGTDRPEPSGKVLDSALAMGPVEASIPQKLVNGSLQTGSAQIPASREEMTAVMRSSLVQDVNFACQRILGHNIGSITHRLQQTGNLQPSAGAAQETSPLALNVQEDPGGSSSSFRHEQEGRSTPKCGRGAMVVDSEGGTPLESDGTPSGQRSLTKRSRGNSGAQRQLRQPLVMRDVNCALGHVRERALGAENDSEVAVEAAAAGSPGQRTRKHRRAELQEYLAKDCSDDAFFENAME
jgi:hypothetical protein